MTTTPTSGGRAHIARRSHSLTNGRSQLILRCKCGDWDSWKLGLNGTVREIEDAHRAHRVAMGETVKERVPSPTEAAQNALRQAMTQIRGLKIQIIALESMVGEDLAERLDAALFNMLANYDSEIDYDTARMAAELAKVVRTATVKCPLADLESAYNNTVSASHLAGEENA